MARTDGGEVRLGILINRWRRVEDIGIQDVAKRIGISASTLSRIENGEATDSKTLTKVLAWILEEKTYDHG